MNKVYQYQKIGYGRVVKWHMDFENELLAEAVKPSLRGSGAGAGE